MNGSYQDPGSTSASGFEPANRPGGGAVGPLTGVELPRCRRCCATRWPTLWLVGEAVGALVPLCGCGCEPTMTGATSELGRGPVVPVAAVGPLTPVAPVCVVGWMVVVTPVVPVAAVAPVALVLVAVSYTHLRAHETGRNLVCRLLLEKKKK